MSETTFDGTLIPETSFETLRSEDSLAKRVDGFGAEKPTIYETRSRTLIADVAATECQSYVK